MIKKRTAALLLAALLLGLTACSEKTPASSQVSSEAPVSSSASSAPVSSAASSSTPSAPSSSEASSSQAESSTPSAPVSSAGTGHSRLPAVDTEDPAFAAAFEENDIDAAFLLEEEDASSTVQMVQLYNKYAMLWQGQGDALYKELLDKVSGEAREELKKSQEAWVGATPAAIEKIKSDAAGAGSSASLTAASGIMQYYRARTAELASIHFQLDGTTGILYMP